MLQELEKAIVSCWRYAAWDDTCIRFSAQCAAALTVPFLLSRFCIRNADAGEATSVRMTQSVAIARIWALRLGALARILHRVGSGGRDAFQVLVL